jgi:hypothetical protein
MKTYKTYQARNAVKAAQVTNHIKAQKKLGVTHEKAKAEAYRLYQIKAAMPILRLSFEEARTIIAPQVVKVSTPSLPPLRRGLPPLPPLPQGLATNPPSQLQIQ